MAYLSYEQIDCSSPAVQDADALTIPASATHAELQAQAEGDINYTMDGTTQPGASSGMVLRSTDSPKTFLIEDLRNIRFVKSGAATKLNVHYFGGRDI